MNRPIDRDEDPLEFARVLNLSDAIFGVAMTLLVISIVIPPGLSSREFTAAVVELIPRLSIMALSIAVAAAAWSDHRHLFGMVQKIDGGLLVRNIVLLGFVALIPLPHQLLGTYANEPLSYVLYALVLGGVNATQVLLEVHVRRRGLLREAVLEPASRLEAARGLLGAAGFGISIPLAFVLGSWTPLVWLAILPLDRVLVRRASRGRRRRAPVEPSPPDG
ncbi:TMEM175 family protein [Naasia sp. SYSU D00057]|uniref:TMEM175 family protein n=1 Tax=Naasia sp. SYSU D00057 TaxID=2817380 RepID=UPI001B3134F5|nr:TMEM175 family protein [Naasia sp. SYSU D00057]